MILVFAETQDGKLKKSALETVYFGSQMAAAQNSTCVALVIGKADDAGRLGQFGASDKGPGELQAIPV